MADIGPDRVDVAEIYDAFTGSELQGIAAYGLAPPEQVGAAMAAYDFGEAGRLPICPAGYSGKAPHLALSASSRSPPWRNS